MSGEDEGDDRVAEVASKGSAGSPDDAARRECKRRTEKWFVRRGVPHLIDDYNAREDILTRIAPFLLVMFLVQVFAPNVNFPWWGNVAVIAVSAALVLALVVGINRLRHRPPFQRPDKVGAPEILAFVFVPAILSVVLAEWAIAASVVVFNVVLLVLAYFVASYGIIATTRWAFGQLVHQLRNVGPLLARSLPLLLLITMFMFFNAELWKVVDDLPPGFLAVALGILVLSGSMFVVLSLRAEIDAVDRFAWWSEIEDAAAGTPVADLPIAGLVDPPRLHPLSRREQLNVSIVLFFTQAVQILVVTLGITIFYVVFGSVTIIDTTIVQWTGSEVIDVFWQFDLLGGEVVVTGELVRTALFVGAIAGLQFTVSALTDSTYRKQFDDEVTRGLRQVMAVRALYQAELV